MDEFLRQVDARVEAMGEGVQEAMDSGHQAVIAAMAAFKIADRVSRQTAATKRSLYEMICARFSRKRGVDDRRSLGAADQLLEGAALLGQETRDVEAQRQRTAEFVRRQRAGVLTEAERAQHEADTAEERRRLEGQVVDPNHGKASIGARIL